MAKQFAMQRLFASPQFILRKAVEATLRTLQAQQIQWIDDDQAATGQLSVSYLTCGERITISIATKGLVQVVSEQLAAEITADRGRNAENCREVLAEIQRRVS